MADQVMTYKYVVRNVARAAGKTATFMPKPIFGDNGSGMHTHQSLWKEGTPLFSDKSGYAGLSQLARSYLGGHHHARARAARLLRADDELVPAARARLRGACQPRLLAAEPLGCDPHPHVLGLGRRPSGSSSAAPTPTANPYLAFAAMLMAGIDGVQKGLDPGEPADFDLFEDRHGDIAQVPGSLAEALDALERDHEFLLAGGVFSEELIRTWIDYKREQEVDVVALRPHPAEFALYYDA